MAMQSGDEEAARPDEECEHTCGQRPIMKDAATLLSHDEPSRPFHERTLTSAEDKNVDSYIITVNNSYSSPRSKRNNSFHAQALIRGRREPSRWSWKKPPTETGTSINSAMTQHADSGRSGDEADDEETAVPIVPTARSRTMSPSGDQRIHECPSLNSINNARADIASYYGPKPPCVCSCCRVHWQPPSMEVIERIPLSATSRQIKIEDLRSIDESASSLGRAAVGYITGPLDAVVANCEKQVQSPLSDPLPIQTSNSGNEALNEASCECSSGITETVDIYPRPTWPTIDFDSSEEEINVRRETGMNDDKTEGERSQGSSIPNLVKIVHGDPSLNLHRFLSKYGNASTPLRRGEKTSGYSDDECQSCALSSCIDHSTKERILQPVFGKDSSEGRIVNDQINRRKLNKCVSEPQPCQNKCPIHSYVLRRSKNVHRWRRYELDGEQKMMNVVRYESAHACRWGEDDGYYRGANNKGQTERACLQTNARNNSRRQYLPMRSRMTYNESDEQNNNIVLEHEIPPHIRLGENDPALNTKVTISVPNDLSKCVKTSVNHRRNEKSSKSVAINLCDEPNLAAAGDDDAAKYSGKVAERNCRKQNEKLISQVNEEHLEAKNEREIVTHYPRWRQGGSKFWNELRLVMAFRRSRIKQSSDSHLDSTSSEGSKNKEEAATPVDHRPSNPELR